jgi:hypothetical protein
LVFCCGGRTDGYRDISIFPGPKKKEISLYVNEEKPELVRVATISIPDFLICWMPDDFLYNCFGSILM